MSYRQKNQDPRKRDLAKPIILLVVLIVFVNIISPHKSQNNNSNTIQQNTTATAPQNPQQANGNNPAQQPQPAQVLPTAPSNYPMDDNYRMEIIAKSGNPTYKVENLSSIVGPEELGEFIKGNNTNAFIYTPSSENLIKGLFRANFHIHTTNSDGALNVKEVLDQAEAYSTRINNKFYIAITDHETVQGLKQIVDILQQYPNKYKNLKIVLGIELTSKLEADLNVMKYPITMHVLGLAINPYDEELNASFSQKGPTKTEEGPTRDFKDAFRILRDKGLAGIAHPLRYVTADNIIGDKKRFYNYMIGKYVMIGTKQPLFAEGYYQSYPANITKAQINEFNESLRQSNIMLTGGTDTHGKSIFRR